jgi:hypothetical protein
MQYNVLYGIKKTQTGRKKTLWIRPKLCQRDSGPLSTALVAGKAAALLAGQDLYS